MVISTNKRIISINVQGITGKKDDYTSLAYSIIQAFFLKQRGLLIWIVNWNYDLVEWGKLNLNSVEVLIFVRFAQAPVSLL